MTSPKDQMTQQEIDDWLMSLGEAERREWLEDYDDK